MMRSARLGLFLLLWACTTGSAPCTTTATVVAVGRSMAPYLWDGESLALECRPPQRGELAVFHSGSGQALIKWVVAVPGDLLAMEDDRLIVNGIIVATAEGIPYRFRGIRAVTLSALEGVVPAGHVIVLGNLVDGTDDSSRYGLIDIREVIGTARKQSGPVGYVDTMALRHSGNPARLFSVIAQVAAAHRIHQVVTTNVIIDGTVLDLTEGVRTALH